MAFYRLFESVARSCMVHKQPTTTTDSGDLPEL